MARIRTIKPEFFRHGGLFDAEQETGLPLRVAFAGLWTAADREGRFEWRPRELKLDCLPYDEVDFSAVLEALRSRGFIIRYIVGDVHYGVIPSWADHQVVNNREIPSRIPSPVSGTFVDESDTSTRGARVDDASGTRQARDDDASVTRHGNYQGEGKGTYIGNDACVTRHASVTDAICPTKPKSRKTAAQKTPIPPDFAISDAVRLWAEAKGYRNLDRHLENFVDVCRAKDYRYVDWDAAFMSAVRNDWARLGEARRINGSAHGPPQTEPGTVTDAEGRIWHIGADGKPYRKAAL